MANENRDAVKNPAPPGKRDVNMRMYDDAVDKLDWLCDRFDRPRQSVVTRLVDAAYEAAKENPDYVI